MFRCIELFFRDSPGFADRCHPQRPCESAGICIQAVSGHPGGRGAAGKTELCGQWADSENTWITGIHQQTKATAVSAGSNTDYGGFLFVGLGMCQGLLYSGVDNMGKTSAEIGRSVRPR